MNASWGCWLMMRLFISIILEGETIRMQNVKEEVKKYVEEMMAAASCSKEAKAAGEKWLALADHDDIKAETRALIKELEGDIMPIDGLIAFVDSPAGAQVFGKDGAKKMSAHAHELKDNGAGFCDCGACAAVAKILARKDELLAAMA